MNEPIALQGWDYVTAVPVAWPIVLFAILPVIWGVGLPRRVQARRRRRTGLCVHCGRPHDGQASPERALCPLCLRQRRRRFGWPALIATGLLLLTVGLWVRSLWVRDSFEVEYRHKGVWIWTNLGRGNGPLIKVHSFVFDPYIRQIHLASDQGRIALSWRRGLWRHEPEQPRDRHPGLYGTWQTGGYKGVVHPIPLRHWLGCDVWDTRDGPLNRYITATCPTWLAALGLSACPAWRLLRRRQFRAFPPGLCRNCGYDLRATPDPAGPRLGRCPECGLETT